MCEYVRFDVWAYVRPWTVALLCHVPYPALHELEEHHGVDLGFAYKTEVSAQTFTHYITES